MGIEVLNGTPIGDIPVHFAKKLRSVYNSDTANRLNIEIPTDLLTELEDLNAE